MATTEAIELNTLLQLLPACTRCRAVRKRCDTLLPGCANCARSGLQCTFYDSVSEELLPREYISSMIDHLRSLEATRARVRTPIRQHFSSPGVLVNMSSSYHFLGGNAPLAAAVEAAAAVGCRGHSTIAWPSPPAPSSASIDDAMHQFLVSRYVQTVHELFPVLDDHPDSFLQSLRDDSNASPSGGFLLNMIYSIACHCLPCNDSRLASLSNTLYRQSLIHLESVMKDTGLGSLQAVLLLALRCTFDTQTGSMGQLVNFASRLEIELRFRAAPETMPLLQRMQCTIYCLTGVVTAALDRRYDLAAPSSTAMSFTTEKAQLLCAVYAWQSRHHAGDEAVPSAQSPILLNHLEELPPWPTLVTLVRQTQFFVHPSPQAAQQLLAACDDDKTIYNIFTSHWIYGASSYLLNHPRLIEYHYTESCIVAAKTLERCAAKWPGSRDLQAALVDLRRSRQSGLAT